MGAQNFGRTLVVTPPSPATSGLSFTVTASTGEQRLGVGPVALCPPDVDPIPENAEIVMVSAISGDTITIPTGGRAQEGTTARAVAAGWQVIQGWTAAEKSNVTRLDPTDAGTWLGQEATAPPAEDGDAEPWLTMQAPHSAGDNNADTIQLKSTTVGGTAFRTSWFNGNNEFRSAPSLANRVGFRAFELEQAIGGPSTGRFAEFSTNPTIAANREPLLGVYGTGHATKPGWVEATRTVSALQGLRFGGDYNSLTALTLRGKSATSGAPTSGTWIAGDAIIDSDGALWVCTVGGTPGTWVGTGAVASAFQAITPGTNVTAASKAAASRLDPGAETVRLRGELVAGASISAGTTIGTIVAAHRPAVEVNAQVRYSGGGARFTVSTGGAITLGAALGNGDRVWFDSLTYDRLA